MSLDIFSIGHSDLTYERFAGLLKRVCVSAVADVRSVPFSRRAPWFSRPELQRALRADGISYAFLGEELGGRPSSASLFEKGVANYTAMAKTAEFELGLERVLRGCQKHRIALVCSERDPLHCHRCLLVGRVLTLRGVSVQHIHHNQRIESQESAEDRLLIEENLRDADLLHPRDDRIAEAYLRRSKKVAFAGPDPKLRERQWSITP